MDRCPLCHSTATFYGIQSRPIIARWLVCYSCRGLRQTATGYPDSYTYRTDNGEVGTTQTPPSKGFFRTGKDTLPERKSKYEVDNEVA